MQNRLGVGLCRAVLVLALCCGSSVQARSGITVSISTSVGSPQPVGSMITITGTAVDSGPGPVNYKFEIETPGSTSFTMLSDFSVSNTIACSPNVNRWYVHASCYRAGPPCRFHQHSRD